MLGTRCSSARASTSVSFLLSSPSSFTYEKINYFEDKGHSVARFSALIAKYFNDYTIDYELSSIPEFIVYEFHDSLVMKLID